MMLLDERRAKAVQAGSHLMRHRCTSGRIAAASVVYSALRGDYRGQSALWRHRQKLDDSWSIWLSGSDCTRIYFLPANAYPLTRLSIVSRGLLSLFWHGALYSGDAGANDLGPGDVCAGERDSWKAIRPARIARGSVAGSVVSFHGELRLCCIDRDTDSECHGPHLLRLRPLAADEMRDGNMAVGYRHCIGLVHLAAAGAGDALCCSAACDVVCGMRCA